MPIFNRQINTNFEPRKAKMTLVAQKDFKNEKHTLVKGEHVEVSKEEAKALLKAGEFKVRTV